MPDIPTLVAYGIAILVVGLMLRFIYRRFAETGEKFSGHASASAPPRPRD